MLQPFLRAFWITISRDFHSLDRLRLDKYLFLIRCYVGVAFQTLLKKGGNGDSPSKEAQAQSEKSKKKRKRGSRDQDDASHLKKKPSRDSDSVQNGDDSAWAELETYIDMMEEGPLCPLNFDPNDTDESSTKMPKGPDGIRYHLFDIWLDEIEKCATEQVKEAGEDEDESQGEEQTKTKLKDGIPIELLLRPIERLRKDSPNKVVRNKAKEVLEDERLIQWGVREPKKVEEDDEDEDEWGGIDG